jgi:hypothetical protein
MHLDMMDPLLSNPAAAEPRNLIKPRAFLSPDDNKEMRAFQHGLDGLLRHFSILWTAQQKEAGSLAESSCNDSHTAYRPIGA